MKPKRKTQGFPGQVLHFCAPALQEQIFRNPLCAGLHAIHLGRFPCAQHHYVSRPEGIADSILIYCDAGRGWFEIDGKRQTLGPRQALLIPSGKPHLYGAEVDDPWTIYWVHFGGTVAATYHVLLPKNEYVVPVARSSSEELKRIFEKAFRTISSGWNIRTMMLVSHILRYELGLIFFDGPKLWGAASRVIVHDLSASLQFMREHLTRPLSLRELAQRAGISSSRFSALFKEQTGVSPIDHHIRLRMQAACHLLDTTAMSIKEIAVHLGYEDPYYFSRIFRKVSGSSPLAYRRALKG